MARQSRIQRAAAVFFAVVMLWNAGAALAQTPDSACAADSLYLISPVALDLNLETTGRLGLTVSWPNLDLDEATCFSLKYTDDLDFGVQVSGGFGGKGGRVFRFTSPNEGMVGAVQPDNIIVSWQNVGPATYGNIAGVMNLANNGGILKYTSGSGWSGLNEGLPMYWRQVNTVGMAAGSGDFLIAGFSRGVTSDSDPVGLFTFDGTKWTQIAQNTFNSKILITGIAVAPGDNNMFAVGTARNGLYITTDGGQTFTRWTIQFDPTYGDMPTNFSVNTVDWSSNQLFVFIKNFGLFRSTDEGNTFVRSVITVPANLDSESPEQILPTVNAISFHPTDPNRILASLEFHGVYESMDGGVTWENRYGDLVVADPENPGSWVNSGLDAIYDDVSPQTFLLGVKQKGLFRTTDDGATYVEVAKSLQPANPAEILNMSMVRVAGSPGTIMVQEDKNSLLISSNSGAAWEDFFFQPVISKGYFLVSDATGSGDLILGTWGGGIYQAGVALPLASTYTTATTASLRTLDLGLDMTFTAGSFKSNELFELVCQTFQGWAVWRGLSNNPEDMTLLGLYDRVNPEDCIEGYCGNVDIEVIPNCFATKRAACFNLDNPDTIRFFDEEVYNGFVYNYSVTSFDYGNTALTTPENNSNEMLFSPRFEGDYQANGGLSPFSGPGNQTPIQINEPIGISETGYDEIYVFPNPLRDDAGFPRDEGGAVTFKNIPPGSNILVFTTSGDRVIDIGPEDNINGNVHWDTNNSSGESINSGVFLYKVEIPEKDPYWGRLVVIR